MGITSIYLASQSPRRRELLEQIGIAYEVLAVDVIEQRHQDESPAEYVQRLSYDKARAGGSVAMDKPVLGADTIVVLDDAVLEKPTSKEDAVAMLLALSHQTHQVMTAVTVWFDGESETQLITTEVMFREIVRQEAERYWETGEPRDKAGAYAIQGRGAMFVSHVQGSYSGVVGLPLFEVSQLLKRWGVRAF